SPSMLTSDPASVTFAQTVVGQSATPVPLTIHNIGGASTGPLSLAITGANVGSFSTTNDTCSGQALAGGGMCTLAVSFAPTAAGQFGATLTIGDGTKNLLITLSGTAVGPALLTVDPTAFSFGAVAPGQSVGHSFVIANTGASTSGPLMLAMGGTD